MKTLILMRHGEAASAEGGADFERALTPCGQVQARHIGEQIAAKGLWPDAVLCSAARRTRETCEEAAAIWREEHKPEITLLREIYGGDTRILLELIQARRDGHAALMLIGHNPAIHMLVQQLAVEGGLKKEPSLASSYPPASCTVLHFGVESWGKVTPRTGRLLDYLRPSS